MAQKKAGGMVESRDNNKESLPNSLSPTLDKQFPEDLIYQCLKFLDLRALWSYGLTSKAAAELIFKSDRTRDLLRALRLAFERDLKRTMTASRVKRIQLGAAHESWSLGFWGSTKGHVISKCYAHHYASFLDVYPSFASFLCPEVCWNTRRLGKFVCDPVIHDGTIVYASSPTMMCKANWNGILKGEVEERHQVDALIWAMTLVPSSSDPSIVLTTSQGLLHLPNIFSSKDTFLMPVLYTADWAVSALSPVIVQWDKGGHLVVTRSALPEHSDSVQILRLKHGIMNDRGLITFPSYHKLAVHESGVLAVYKNLMDVQHQLEFWLVTEDHCYELISDDPKKTFAFLRKLIWLDFIGKTLLGITECGTVICWDLQGTCIGRLKLARSIVEGMIESAIFWPRRGSFFLISRNTGTRMHEWVIGSPFVNVSLSCATF